MDEMEKRQRVIVRTSLIGIAVNVLLAAFKAAVGLFSHSIAVVLDAVNNLSDAMSSVITIIGARLGGKAPDKDHPYGYGRVEYISSMLVAALVIFAGITSLNESIKKILDPADVDYSTTSLIIIAVAIAAKLLLGRYVKKKGEKVNSGALIASGSDASFDAILSASVLGSAIIYLAWGISIEAWVGAVISIFIIKSGIEMMIGTLDDIIGHRTDPEISARVRSIIEDEPEVRGAYDVNLYNYGPDKYYGSVHLELPDTMNVDKVDQLTRRIEKNVYCETGVILTGVGVYSYNTSDDEASQIRNTIQKKIIEYDWALQMHGFYVDTEKKEIRFDVVVSFDVDRIEALGILYREAAELYPDYSFQIVTDIDTTN